MIKYKFWITFFLCACAPTPELDEQEDLVSKSHVDPISICYNINSKEHGKICSAECTEPGNQSTFCWEIHPEDCNGQHSEEWQRENCHFFD